MQSIFTTALFTMPPVYPCPYGASHNDRPPPPTRRNHYLNYPRFSQPGNDEFWEQVEYSHPSFPPTIDPNNYHPQVSSNYMPDPYHQPTTKQGSAPVAPPDVSFDDINFH